jgi:hypothetical protein
MSWEQVTEYVELASGVAGILALVTFVIGLRWARRTSREGTAKANYQSYLDKAMENPRYSDNYPWPTQGEDQQRYEWFVSYLLNSSEAILTLYPRDPAWISTIDSQLGYHLPYLRSDKFWNEEFSMYDNALKARLCAVTGRAPPATATE